jgi:hypothetical protein
MTYPKGYKNPNQPYSPSSLHTKVASHLLGFTYFVAFLFLIGGTLLIISTWVYAPSPIANRNGIIAVVLAFVLFITGYVIQWRRVHRTLPRPRSSGKAIAALIIFAISGLIIYEIWSYTVGEYERRQQLLDAGCDPEAWNQYGTPTIWICSQGST